MKNWKTLSSLLIINFFLVFLPLETADSCGFSEDDLYFGYDFFDTQVADERTEEFLLTIPFGEYEELEDLYERQSTANVKEWQIASCQMATEADIYELIYNSSLTELEALRKAAKSGRNISGGWATNAFAKELVRNKCVDTYDYLIFAKRCEPHVTEGSAWSDKPQMNADVLQLIDDGKRNLLRTENHYLRLRYMYQIVRLAHYADDYQLALDLYEELDPKVDESESLIQWWLLGHKAGCLKRLGNTVEASYLFSLVFMNCPSKREQVYKSFTINDDEEWNACVTMCKSDAERANLYAIRAMDKHSRVVEELEQIYAIEPKSPFILPLVLREVKHMEEVFLGADFRKENYFTPKVDEIAKNNLIHLLDLVKKVEADGNMEDAGLWKVMEGYLEYLSRDLYAAAKTFDQAESLVAGNEKLEYQVKLFQLVLKITSLTKINDEVELEIYDIIRENDFYEKVPNFPDFMFDKLAHLYKNQNEYEKAFLCNYSLYDLETYPVPDIINNLIRLAGLEELNKFEEMILKKKIGEEFSSKLHELKGTYHLSKGELSEAIRAFNSTKTEDLSETFYPFYLPINDCVHCELPEDTTMVFLNKIDLSKQLLELEYKAKTDIDKASIYYYQLGTAYYNMSYYGNTHAIMDYYRTSQSWREKPKGDATEFKPYGNREYTDMSKAFYYFEKARELATDNEVAARASFMAAKCELNQFYQDDKYEYSYWSNDMPRLPEKYRNYYDLLKNKYNDTDFYQEAKESCKYFDFYVTNGY